MTNAGLSRLVLRGLGSTLLTPLLFNNGAPAEVRFEWPAQALSGAFPLLRVQTPVNKKRGLAPTLTGVTWVVDMQGVAQPNQTAFAVFDGQPVPPTR